jgi:transposase, IS30 family
LNQKGYSYEAIGLALGRAKSAIWNELHRNKTKEIYTPKLATDKARLRRHDAKYQGKNIVAHKQLRVFVDTQLILGQSPEAISGRLKYKYEKGLPYVSKDSIYRYLKSIHGRKIEAKLKKQKRRKIKFNRKGILDGRVFIDKRPEYINNRIRIGHAEFDFIVSGRGGKGILLVVVDRKLRVSFLEPIYKVSISEVHRAMASIKARYLEWQTGTTDNDLLFARHKELEQELSIKIFFCHQYSSWEKGTVENTNKEVRRDIPKGSDISKYSRDFIQRVEDKLNNRFMKCLNYMTPAETLAQCQKQKSLRERRKDNRSN